MEINDNFYTNLSLNHITKVKNILEEIKSLKYGINHDFINNIDLFDNHINKNSLSYLNDDSLIEENADEDIDSLEHIKQRDLRSDNSIKSYTEENTIDISKEKLLVDSKFVDYIKKYSSDKQVWWPIKLSYGVKKYCSFSHITYLNYYNKKKLYYMCVNHLLNTSKKNYVL